MARCLWATRHRASDVLRNQCLASLPKGIQTPIVPRATPHPQNTSKATSTMTAHPTDGRLRRKWPAICGASTIGGSVGTMPEHLCICGQHSQPAQGDAPTPGTIVEALSVNSRPRCTDGEGPTRAPPVAPPGLISEQIQPAPRPFGRPPKTRSTASRQ